MDSWKNRLKALAVITLLSSGSGGSMLAQNTRFFTSTVAYAEANVKSEDDHWASKDMNRFVNLGIVKGDENGRLNPENKITRAEFCSILSKVLNLKDIGEGEFSDVESEAWYREDILKLKKLGVFKGSLEDGKILARPNDNLTREEAVTLLSRAFNILDGENISSKSTGFVDGGQIASYAVRNMDRFIDEGYLNGYEDNTIKPKSNLSRAESMALISRIGEKIILESGTYEGENISSNIIIGQANVKLKNMTVGKNIYLTPGSLKGDLELEDVKVIGKLILNKNLGGKNRIIIKNSDIGSLSLGDGLEIKTEGRVKIHKLSLDSDVKEIIINGEKIDAKELSSNKLMEKLNNSDIEKEKQVENKSSEKDTSRRRSGGSRSSDREKVVDDNKLKPIEEGKPDETKKVDLVEVNKTRMMEIEGTRYILTALKVGSIEDYKFTVNGKIEKFIPVNSQGTIVKFELGEEPKSFEVEHKNGEKQVLTFGKVIETESVKDSDIGLENTLKLLPDGKIGGDLRLKINNKVGEFDLDGLSGSTKYGSNKNIYVGQMPEGLKSKFSLEDKNKTLVLTMDGKIENSGGLNNKVFDLKFLSSLLKNANVDFKQWDGSFKIGLEDKKPDDGKKEEKLEAKLMEIEGSKYLIVNHSGLEEKVLDILVDGVSRKFTPVNLSNSVKKWEIDGKNPKSVELKLKSKNIEIKVN